MDGGEKTSAHGRVACQREHESAEISPKTVFIAVLCVAIRVELDVGLVNPRDVAGAAIFSVFSKSTDERSRMSLI